MINSIGIYVPQRKYGYCLNASCSQTTTWTMLINGAYVEVHGSMTFFSHLLASILISTFQSFI